MLTTMPAEALFLGILYAPCRDVLCLEIGVWRKGNYTLEHRAPKGSLWSDFSFYCLSSTFLCFSSIFSFPHLLITFPAPLAILLTDFTKLILKLYQNSILRFLTSKILFYFLNCLWTLKSRYYILQGRS